jgi:hypothetical protein
MIDSLLEYAGKSKRSGDLFSNKDFFAKAKKNLGSVFKVELSFDTLGCEKCLYSTQASHHKYH